MFYLIIRSFWSCHESSPMCCAPPKKHKELSPHFRGHGTMNSSGSTGYPNILNAWKSSIVLIYLDPNSNHVKLHVNPCSVRTPGLVRSTYCITIVGNPASRANKTQTIINDHLELAQASFKTPVLVFQNTHDAPSLRGWYTMAVGAIGRVTTERAT